VNAGKYKTVFHLLLVLVIVQAALADSARVSTSRGNKLYKQGNFNEAINSYDQALLETPGALEPKFNQANSYYRLDDLGKAMDLYRQVAAESKDMKHVARAKYNLGNSYFQQGSKQKDSNLQKAIDDLKTAIGSWRGVLDIEPENKKAAKILKWPGCSSRTSSTNLTNSNSSRTPISRRIRISNSSRINSNKIRSKIRINRRTNSRNSKPLSRTRTSRKILINHRTSSRNNSKRTRNSNSRPPPIRGHRKFWIKNSVSEKKGRFYREAHGKKSKKTGKRSDK